MDKFVKNESQWCPMLFGPQQNTESHTGLERHENDMKALG